MLCLQEVQWPKDVDFITHSNGYIFGPRLQRTEAKVAVALRKDIAFAGHPTMSASPWRTNSSTSGAYISDQSAAP